MRYPVVSSPRGNRLLFICASLWGFLRLRKTFRPDLIHAHVTLPAGVVGCIVSRAFRIPLVITEHQGPFSVQMETWRQRALVRSALSRAQAILPVSNSLKRDMQSYGLKGRYFVTPNTVDFTIFHRSAETINGQRRILVVAMLTPAKGLSFFLKAIALLRHRKEGFVVDIVGDGQERQSLEDMAQESGIDHLVHFHGLRSKEQVGSFMQRSSFLVLPSLAETFGCVVAEALACGKPVVVTKCGGPEDFVNEEVGTLVPPGDVDSLAAAMDDMLDRYRTYDPNRISGYAKERFSHEAVGAAINEVYKSVLSCKWTGQ